MPRTDHLCITTKAGSLASVAASLALLGGVAGCGGAESGLTRSALFGLTGADPVQQIVEEPSRIVAVYWPQPRCLSCQIPARAALERVGSDHEAVRVVSVVPRRDSNPSSIAGLPGEVVELPAKSYARQTARLPAPRLEVWGDGGRQLHLLKRLPPIVDEEALAEEIRSCLSFSSSGAQDSGAG